MSYNRFLELVLKKKSGELSPEEQAELNQFLTDNPGYHELSGMVDQLYNLPYNEIREVDNSYIKNRWNSLRSKTNDKAADVQGAYEILEARRLRIGRSYLIATSVAAAVLVCVFLLFNLRDVPVKDVIVATKFGSRTTMKLPDGSTVLLNAGSKLSYGEDFGKANRDVQLSGEAYFDVVHDADRPFIVHTNDFDIKVLGTAFNVKAYAGDKESQATLVRGLIELSLKREDSRKILLKPNEKLTFRNIEDSVKQKIPAYVKPEIKITGLERPFNDSLAVETQWLNNCLAFRDCKLKDVAILISRWYNVSVEIYDEDLKNKEFSGMFKDENVEQVLQALKLAGGFHYTINKNIITIVP